jgi:hypothetical protein
MKSGMEFLLLTSSAARHAIISRGWPVAQVVHERAVEIEDK